MKIVKRKNIIAAMLLGSVLITTGCAQQDTKTPPKNEVATINMQVVMENHPDMMSAQNKMKDEYDKIRNDIKDTDGLSPEQKQKKIMESQKELQDVEKTTFEPIQNSINTTIDAVMKDNGISTVVDKRAIVRGGKDITKDVLVKDGIDETKAQEIIDKSSQQPTS